MWGSARQNFGSRFISVVWERYIVQALSIQKLLCFQKTYNCFFFGIHSFDQFIVILNCELKKQSRSIFQYSTALNVTKNKYTIFHKLQTNLLSNYPALCIRNDFLYRFFFSCKCLGVNLDPSLSFNLHVQTVSMNI